MKYASQTERRLGLRIHGIVFIPTMVVLFIINVWTGSPYWVLWVLAGWAIGLIAHWLSVRYQGARNSAVR